MSDHRPIYWGRFGENKYTQSSLTDAIYDVCRCRTPSQIRASGEIAFVGVSYVELPSSSSELVASHVLEYVLDLLDGEFAAHGSPFDPTAIMKDASKLFGQIVTDEYVPSRVEERACKTVNLADWCDEYAPHLLGKGNENE